MSDMTFRRLGSSGLTVSAVGLGTNNFGQKLDMPACREVLDAALDAGITLIDTSDTYGQSEERLGELLVGRRDDVIIATKFGMDPVPLGNGNGADWGARGSRRYVKKAVEASLRRLRTDWIDLYQFHWPDPETPIEETLSALDDLIRDGKIRYIGHSSFAGWQIAEAEWAARARGTERFISTQANYSLLERGIEGDVVPPLEKYGIGLLPFWPLASGLLSGKYRRGEKPPAGSRIQAWKREHVLTDSTFDKLEALESFAEARGVSLLQVAIGGLLAMPAVASVIAGATSADQVNQNVEASRWQPTEDDLAELRLITAPS